MPIRNRLCGRVVRAARQLVSHEPIGGGRVLFHRRRHFARRMLQVRGHWSPDDRMRGLVERLGQLRRVLPHVRCGSNVLLRPLPIGVEPSSALRRLHSRAKGSSANSPTGRVWRAKWLPSNVAVPSELRGERGQSLPASCALEHSHPLAYLPSQSRHPVAHCHSQWPERQ